MSIFDWEPSTRGRRAERRRIVKDGVIGFQGPMDPNMIVGLREMLRLKKKQANYLSSPSLFEANAWMLSSTLCSVRRRGGGNGGT